MGIRPQIGGGAQDDQKVERASLLRATECVPYGQSPGHFWPNFDLISPLTSASLSGADDILDRFEEVDELLASSLPDQILESFRRPSLNGEDDGLNRRTSGADIHGDGRGEDEPLLKRESGAEDRQAKKDKRETLMLNGQFNVLPRSPC
jgi:hypothetical protein